jgi:hypothetical protein
VNGVCSYFNCPTVSPWDEVKSIGMCEDKDYPNQKPCCCAIRTAKPFSNNFNQIGTTWTSKLTAPAKKVLWIVFGSALSRDEPVVIEENVNLVKFKPAQSGKLKILAITFDPEIKVYKYDVQVTPEKKEADVILSCLQTDSSIECEWFNCKLKDKIELTIFTYVTSGKPAFTEIIPVSSSEGSAKGVRVERGTYLAALSCANGESMDLIEVK